MKQPTCLAEYQSEVGVKRRLVAVKSPSGWWCRFQGSGLGRNSRGYYAVTPQGVSLLASLYVATWGGRWSTTFANFPPVPTTGVGR